MAQELLPLLLQPFFFRGRLVLNKPEEGRRDAGGGEIGPDPRSSSVVDIFREEVGRVVWICFFEELAHDGGFVEWFALVVDGWDQA